MTDGRRPSPAWSVVAMIAGLLVMGGAGIRAGRYLPGWSAPDPACVVDGTCTWEQADAALRSLWWVVGGGGLVVLLAVGLFTWCLSPVPVPPSGRPLRPGQHATAVGVLGGLTFAALGMPILLAMFVSWHAVPAALLGSWLVQATVVTAGDRTWGAPASARASWLRALAITALATAGTVGVGVGGGGLPASLLSVPVVHGVALAAAVLVARRWDEAPDPSRSQAPRAPQRRTVDAGTPVVVVLAVLSVVTAAHGLRVLPRPAWPEVPDPSVAAPYPAPSPIPAPSPEPPPPPPAPAVAVPCSEEDLSFAAVGFDGAMGARAASLQATNVGSEPCWVEGTPVVVLLQGGRPLSLQVGPGQTPEGAPAPVQRVGLAPGGTALALLTWRSYGGWADSETPQSLTAALDATSSLVPVEVPGASGPAPFDIADGGAWAVAPWAPPWN
jgi:hypothetical protein